MPFLGLTLAGDEQCASHTPTESDKIHSFKLTNGEFDDFIVTKDVDTPFTCGWLPTVWDYNTLIMAHFKENLKTTNVGSDMANADCLRIKRRKKNTFTWITLWEIDPTTDPQGWQFTRVDRTAQSDQDYDYAVLPVAGGIEGNLNITPVYSCFNGIYIFDGGKDGKSFCTHGEYDNPVMRTKPTSQIVTLGNKYPFTVSNGVVDYESGTVSGVFAPLYRQTIDFEKNSRYRDEVLAFMTNGKVKLLKEENGRIWLVQLSDGQVNEDSFIPLYQGDIAKISFNWTEVANAQTGHDLFLNDFIECDIDDISMY